MRLIGCGYLLALLAVFATHSAFADESANPFDAKAYAKTKDTKAIVLLSVNWGRRWKCGSFENAQLKALSFDRSDLAKPSPESAADLTLEDTSILPSAQSFVDYAYIVEPGDYLLSGFKLKAAKSIADVGYFSGNRSTLIEQGVSKAGKFNVAAGEIVYIGHFAVDCAGAPMPWRYYLEDRTSFDKYLASMKDKFDALPIDEAVFRLFDTNVMGQPFTFPSSR